MKDKDEKTITIEVLDRQYKLILNSDNEMIAKEAAASISHQINEFAKIYKTKDRQDLVTMVALGHLIELLQIKSKIQDCKNSCTDETSILSNISNLLSSVEE